MKVSLNLSKRQISILLTFVFFAQGSLRAEWAAVDGGALGPGYQPVLSAGQAEENENSSTEDSFLPVDGGFSSLSLTKADEPQDETQQTLSPEEKEHVQDLLNEILILPEPLPQVELPSEPIHSEQGDHQQSQEPVAIPMTDFDLRSPELAIPLNSNPVFEGYRLGDIQQGLIEDVLERQALSTGLLGSSQTVKAAPGFGDSIHPYQEGPSFFHFQESHVSYLPEAVRQTGVELTIEKGTLPVSPSTETPGDSETPELNQDVNPSLSVRMLEWFISLLDNFEVTLLGPQELEKQSSSGAAAEAVVAAASGPSVTQGQIFPHPWVAAILGATAEVLRLSAEQLRDWLHEAEAFDQGSLRLKISSLRNAVNYLLITEEGKSYIPEPAAQGYRLVNAVNVDQELAALHVLANPPRMHPFVRHVLFETQTVPGMLKRYWLDVEKLKALYAKAGTTDEYGNVYLIRYKGQILKNPYRPMPDDMGGRYELVIAE